MKKIGIIVCIFILGIFIFLSWKGFFIKPALNGRLKNEILYTTVKKNDLTIKLTTKGYLKPLKSTIINAPRRGGKITYLIPEGTYVKEGDLLAEFEKTDLEKAVTDAQYRLEQELINEDKRKADADKKITETYLKLQAARENLQLIIPLVLDGKKTVADLKWAKYNLKEAEINYELAKKTYQEYLIKGSPELRHAREQLQRAKKDLSNAEIKSPSQGLVVYENIWRPGGRAEKIRTGDNVWRSMPILSLPDLSKMLVIVEVNEVDLSRIEIGQGCFIKIDAYPDKTFRGKVTGKGNVIKDSIFVPGVKIVEVEVAIDGEHIFLRPGMTATVDIIISALKNVVYVPIISVFEYENRYYCYVVKGESFIKKEVKIGESTNENIVITEGLDEGEKITLFDPFLKK